VVRNEYQVSLYANSRRAKPFDAYHIQRQTEGYRIRHTQILLAVVEVEDNEEWADMSIAIAYHPTEKSIGILRRRFAEKGLDAVLGR